MLAGAIPIQLMQPVAWRRFQVVEGLGRVDHRQFGKRTRLDILG